MRCFALLAAVGCFPAILAATYSVVPVPGDTERAVVAALLAIGVAGLVDMVMGSVLQ